MKKIFSLLVAVSAACTFSFRKMEESGIVKVTTQPESHLTFVCGSNQADKMFDALREAIELEKTDQYFAYSYDPISKYLCLAMFKNQTFEFPNKDLQFQAAKHAFNILNGQRYPNIEEAKNSFGFLISDQNLLQYYVNHPVAASYPDFNQFAMDCLYPKLILINVDQAPDATISIRQWVKNNKNPDDFFNVLDSSVLKFSDKNIVINQWDKDFVSKSGIKVNNTVKGIKLTKTLKDGQEKTIDFQKALGEYLEKQRNSVDNFSQSLINLFNLVKSKKTDSTNLYRKDITYKGTQREDLLIKEFIEKKEKFCFIEKQYELVNHSEILTIRCIISDAEGAENESLINSDKCTIMGTAIDNDTYTTFHWVTELSSDFKELFED